MAAKPGGPWVSCGSVDGDMTLAELRALGFCKEQIFARSIEGGKKSPRNAGDRDLTTDDTDEKG
jgi:hypothetical protein